MVMKPKSIEIRQYSRSWLYDEELRGLNTKSMSFVVIDAETGDKITRVLSEIRPANM